MRTRVITDGFHFRRVGIAVRKCRFVNRAIQNTAYDIAVTLVHRNKLALKNERQLFHNRRVNELAFRRGKTALRDLIGSVIAAHNPKIIADSDGISRSESDGKRLACGDIRPGLVPSIDADCYFIFKRNAALRSIHHVRSSVFVVCADHQYRHREHPILLPEILFHHHPLSM